MYCTVEGLKGMVENLVVEFHKTKFDLEKPCMRVNKKHNTIAQIQIA